MNMLNGHEFEWKDVNITLRPQLRMTFGTDDLRGISVLDKLMKASRSVAHITISSGDFATGFMISPDILMTNNHVFKSVADAKNAIIRFNYQLDVSGNPLIADDYRCDMSFFYTNEKLDYSIVKVNGSPGSKWGYIELSPDETIKVKNNVSIIQHPEGRYKQIVLSDNEVMYVDNEVIQYLADTLVGSSGSPVFNESAEIIAIHHSGGWLYEPSTSLAYFRNEGIRIAAILNDIRASLSPYPLD